MILQEEDVLGRIPPELYIAEQTQYLKKLIEVVYDHLYVKDNYEYLNIRRKDFMAKGLLEGDYDLMLNSLIDSNKFYDTHKIKDVAKMIAEAKRESRSEIPLHHLNKTLPIRVNLILSR